MYVCVYVCISVCVCMRVCNEVSTFLIWLKIVPNFSRICQVYDALILNVDK